MCAHGASSGDTIGRLPRRIYRKPKFAYNVAMLSSPPPPRPKTATLPPLAQALVGGRAGNERKLEKEPAIEG
jgi:hypothetical protein